MVLLPRLHDGNALTSSRLLTQRETWTLDEVFINKKTGHSEMKVTTGSEGVEPWIDYEILIGFDQKGCLLKNSQGVQPVSIELIVNVVGKDTGHYSVELFLGDLNSKILLTY